MVLNINGKWGSGKTYLSKLVEEDLNKGYVDNQTYQNKIIALRINISDYDYGNDPLVPFIITLLDYVNSDSSFTKDNNKLAIFSTIITVINILSYSSLFIDQTGTLKNLMNKATELVKKKNNKEVPINILESGLENVKAYSKAIDELGKTIAKICDIMEKDKIIIFVDDFDRVSPHFAFKVLNVVHQLKNKIKKLQICTIMNRMQFEKQLQHIYGSTPNDEHYLTKYINLEITTKNPILNDANQFLKEFKFPDSAGNYSFLREWVSLLSVRETQIFSTAYNYKLSKILNDGYELQRMLNTDVAAGHYIVLLYITLVKFDLELRSFEGGLYDLQDCRTLTDRLENFSVIINDTKLYENYNVNFPSGSSTKLKNIVDIVFNFFTQKISRSYLTSVDGGFVNKFDSIKGFIDKAYVAYFKN